MSAVGQDTKDVALRLARDVLSAGDLAFEELFAEDYINHNIPVPGLRAPRTASGSSSRRRGTRFPMSSCISTTWSPRTTWSSSATT